jgi:hypothetical protein
MASSLAMHGDRDGSRTEYHDRYSTEMVSEIMLLSSIGGETTKDTVGLLAKTAAKGTIMSVSKERPARGRKKLQSCGHLDKSH